jgi:hypothetical protein
LASQKEGFHHIGVFVEDIKKYVDKFQKEEIVVIKSGMFPPRLKYAYMDTVKIFGAVIELIEILKRKKMK